MYGPQGDWSAVVFLAIRNLRIGPNREKYELQAGKTFILLAIWTGNGLNPLQDLHTSRDLAALGLLGLGSRV